ncbi:MAG: class I SAM-dependent methyltransferase [Myxococcota bacterium]
MAETAPSGPLDPPPVDWNRTTTDYATHRQGFPARLWEALTERGWLPTAATEVLDVGTGTGTAAVALARRGHRVTALDVAPTQIEAASRRANGLDVTWRVAPAEDTGLATAGFDVGFAGQCWHWFDRARAAQELRRVLRPRADVLIAHLDWLPRGENIPARTEALLRAQGLTAPDYSRLQMGGFYPLWLDDLQGAGFVDVETMSFDVDLVYSSAAWRGRMRASAWLGARHTKPVVDRVDAALAKMLAPTPGPTTIPHRVFVVHAVRPYRDEVT